MDNWHMWLIMMMIDNDNECDMWLLINYFVVWVVVVSNTFFHFEHNKIIKLIIVIIVIKVIKQNELVYNIIVYFD